MNTSTEARPGLVGLRPVDASDEAFLFEVYASTRQEELAKVVWNEAQRESFLRMQFKAQSHHYAAEYPGAEFHVVLVEGQPAGRLYVHRRPKEIRVMDIVLLPRFRGQGIATILMKKLLAEGDRSSRPVTVHVETFNPALRWYERLGFQPVANNGFYRLMEWQPRTRRSPEHQIEPADSRTP